MYFYIQELKTKREVKGAPKEIITGTKNVDGVLVNTYEFGKERFTRPIKKAYRITLHESYRENGKVKQRQYVIATVNYYDIAESYEDDLFDLEGTFFNQLLGKIDSIISKFDILDDEKEYFAEDIYDSFIKKVDPLFNKIQKEFIKTKEGKVFLAHKRLLQKYKNDKQKFMSDNDTLGLEYDICYDLYGNLTNPAYLEKIKRRNSGYQREERNNYNTKSLNNISYTEEQKKILKQFYRVLGKSFHPDSNIGKDTSEQMKLLNKLKEDWGL